MVFRNIDLVTARNSELGNSYGNDKRGNNANLDNRQTPIFWNVVPVPPSFSLIADYKKGIITV